MEEKLKLAGRAYGNGCTCSQAVFCAFARDMGMDETLSYKIMEGFGGGFGSMREMCGALCAAAAVISYCTSSGSIDGASREKTGRAIRRAAEIYWREYGSIRCREIPHGSAPGAFQCGVKVKDAVLVVHKVLKEAVRETTPAGMREL